MRRTFALGLALLAVGGALAQFPISPVVFEGDDVVLLSGTGNVTLINNLSVNNLGQWLVEVDTDFATTTEDIALVRGFQTNPYSTVISENQALSSPPGAQLSSFDSQPLNNLGNASYNWFLRGAVTTSTDSGVFYNGNLVIQESSISTAPQFSANTPYIGWFETKLNDNNQVFMMASVDDPAIASTVDRAIVRVDNPGGAFTETVLSKEGDQLLPGRFVADFGTGQHNMAVSSSSVMFFADLDGTTTDDGTIWIDSTLLAREGSPAPVAGRNWSTLSSQPVDLNESGGYVFRGSMDGDAASNVIIVKNGQKFMQEGDTLAAIGGVFTFTGFGTGPVCIDDSGNVLWYGDWTDPDTTRDKGLFLNDQLIVQEGVTTININGTDYVVDTVRSGESAFQLSDNGEWILFEADMVGGLEGAFLIHVPEQATLVLLALGALALRRR